MNDMTTFNAKREARTESRVAELVNFLATKKYREQIFDKFCVVWNVSEDTVSGVIQSALRSKRIRYERGFYKAA